jgi:hypothetical protein
MPNALFGIRTTKGTPRTNGETRFLDPSSPMTTALEENREKDGGDRAMTLISGRRLNDVVLLPVLLLAAKAKRSMTTSDQRLGTSRDSILSPRHRLWTIRGRTTNLRWTRNVGDVVVLVVVAGATVVQQRQNGASRADSDLSCLTRAITRDTRIGLLGWSMRRRGRTAAGRLCRPGRRPEETMTT